MIKVLCINQILTHQSLDITSIEEHALHTLKEISSYHYIIIHGGDGTIRRVIKALHTRSHQAKYILNPTGSFNVIAKLYKVPKLHTVLDTLAQGLTLPTTQHTYYTLNKEVFLFSAGNMGDLQHIFIAETLRFGLLKKGMLKYLLSLLLLMPMHLIMTPFMLLSSRRFFIFTPLSFIPKFGSFYGKIMQGIEIDLENHYNLIELDGDIITIKESLLLIEPAGTIEITI